MLRAIRNVAKEAKEGDLDPEQITEELFASQLDTRGIPDPDLLIRTSGEERLSNFLLCIPNSTLRMCFGRISIKKNWKRQLLIITRETAGLAE